MRFLQMEVLNFHEVVYWALGIIWFLLLVAAVSSVRSREMAIGGKVTWLVLIVAVPIGGLAVYAVWSLFQADWSFLKPLLQSRNAAARSVAGMRRKG